MTLATDGYTAGGDLHTFRRMAESGVRILVVADWFFPSVPGGLARVAWDVARCLARRGHHVELIAAESVEVLPARVEEVHEGVVVHRFPRPRFPFWDPRRGQRQIGLFREAVARVLPRGFDVVHYHSIFTGMAVLDAVAGRARRPALAYTIHSPIVPEQRLAWAQQGLAGLVNRALGTPLMRGMERRLLDAADVRHTLSRFTTTELAREHPRRRYRFHVIPHWVAPGWRRSLSREEARRRLGWAADVPTFFTVRQLRPRYGIPDAVEAVAPLARAGRCGFRIAGAGPLTSALESRIRDLGVVDRVQLLGRVSDADLQLAYQAADLFLLPTRQLECFGLIILESLGYGLPVLGTAVGAIPETLGPLLPEFLVPPADVPALRAKLESFLDGRLACPPGPALAEQVHRDFGEEVVAGQYERFYADAVGCRTE